MDTREDEHTGSGVPTSCGAERDRRVITREPNILARLDVVERARRAGGAIQERCSAV
jgi:hypothetical protein